MPHSKIDATLDLMTARELSEVHHYVEVWERAGFMGPREAALGIGGGTCYCRFLLGEPGRR